MRSGKASRRAGCECFALWSRRTWPAGDPAVRVHSRAEGLAPAAQAHAHGSSECSPAPLLPARRYPAAHAAARTHPHSHSASPTPPAAGRAARSRRPLPAACCPQPARSHSPPTWQQHTAALSPAFPPPPYPSTPYPSRQTAYRDIHATD